MHNFFVLLLGEIERMKKYGILAASLVVSFIWIGVLHFTEIQDVTAIFPLLIFIDTTSMAMLLVGVTMFYEKQEGTIKTLLVTPTSKSKYILAKTFANILSNLETLIILYLYAILFKEININIIALSGAVILISFFHSFVGFLLTYYSRDFTELLMGMVKYTFIFMVPVILEQAGLIKNLLAKKLLYIIPTKSSLTLLQATTRDFDGWELSLSLLYLVLGCGLLFLVVRLKFDEYAVKESGV